MSNNLAKFGLGGLFLAKRAGDVIADKENTLYKTTVTQKLINTYDDMTKHENHVIGKWNGFAFWSKSNFVRLNAIFQKLINKNSQAESGVISKQTKTNFLNDAKQSMMSAVRIDQFIQILLNNTPNSNKVKSYCDELRFLYLKKRELNDCLSKEISNEDVLRKQEELILVDKMIMNTTKLFRGNVVELFNVDNDNALRPFERLLSQLKISTAGNNNLEEFINVYNLKVGLRSDNDKEFKTALYQDISSYIFAKSTGSLAAKGFIREKYGSFVADILDNSFIGDPDSNNRGRLSEYFMQTVYSLLNDGSKGFNLSELCLGYSSDDVSRKQNQRTVTLPRDNDEYLSIDLLEHTKSYKLNSTGILVLENTLKYYDSMSTINRELIMEDSNFKMLLWNLTGGQNSALDGKYKRGLFFHIDNQLRNFNDKTYGRNSIANYYKKNIEEHYQKAISVLMQPQSSGSNITPSPKDFFTLSKQKAYLSRLSDAASYRMKVIEERRLKYMNVDIANDLKLILNSAADMDDYNKLLEYVKVCFDDNYQTELDEIFLGLSIIRTNSDISPDLSHQSEKLLKSESSETTKLDDTSIKQLVTLDFSEGDNNLTLRYANSYNEEYKTKLNSRNLDIFSERYGSKLDEYLTEYSNKLDKFKKTVKDSNIFKDLSSILTNLDNYKTFLMFYNEMKGNSSKLSGLNKVTDIYTRINLHDNALQVTQEYVKNIITRHTELKEKFNSPTAKLTNEEQQVFIMLSTLFEFVDSSKDQALTKFILSCNSDQTSKAELKSLFKEIPEEYQTKYLGEDIINYMKKDESVNACPKLNNINVPTIYFNKIVDKFAEDIGSIRLINQSFNTLQILLKDRLHDKLQKKLYIVNLFAKLAGEKLEPATLKIIQDNMLEIRDSNHTISKANEIYTSTDNIIRFILTKENDCDKLVVENTNISLQKNIAKLYNNLQKAKFSSNLDSVPAFYQHILTTVLDNTKEPSKFTTAIRLVVAVIMGVDTKYITTGDGDNEQYSHIKGILDNGDKLRKIDRVAFLNTFEAHETLLDTFSKLFNALNSQDAIPYLLIYEEIVFAASNNLPINEIKVAKTNNKVKPIFDDLYQTIDEQDLKNDNQESARTVSFRNKSIVAENLLAKLQEIVTKSLNEKNIPKNNLENNSDMIKGIDDLYQLKRGLEESFADSVKRIKDLVDTLKTSTEKYSILTGQQLSAINDLISNYTTTETKNGEVRSITLNSDLLKPYIGHFNRMLAIYNSDETIKKSYQAEVKALFETLYTEINEKGLNDTKIEFFEISSQTKITDEEFRKVVSQIRTNSSPNETIKDMLERLLADTSKTADFYKQCINMYNYNFLKIKFSEFYIQNFYKIDKFLECYKRLTENMSHDLVSARASEQTQLKNFNLYTKFEYYLQGYDEYQTKYQQAFSDFMNASDTSNAITRVVVKRSFEHDKIVKENYKHMLRFNSLEIIIRDLIKHKAKDVPLLRRVNHVAGIIIYLKDEIANKEKEVLDKLLKLESDLNNFGSKRILDVEKDLFNFLKKYFYDNDTSSTFLKIIYDVIMHFFNRASAVDSATENEIIDLVEGVWEKIISGLNENTYMLTKQVKNVSNIAMKMNDLNQNLTIVKSHCPDFYTELDDFCKAAGAENIISIESVEHKAQELIEEYAHEFSILAESNPDNFEKICSIEFMNKAINSILKSNGTEIIDRTSKFKDYLFLANIKQQLKNDISQGKLKSAISKYQKINLNRKYSPLIIKFDNNEYKFTNDQLIIHLGFTPSSAKYKCLEMIFRYNDVATIDELDDSDCSNLLEVADRSKSTCLVLNINGEDRLYCRVHLRDDNTYVFLEDDNSLLKINYDAKNLKLVKYKYAHVSLLSRSPLNQNEEDISVSIRLKLDNINQRLQEAMGAKSLYQRASKHERMLCYGQITSAAVYQTFNINKISNWAEQNNAVSIYNQSILFIPPRTLTKFMSDYKRSMSVPVFCAGNLYILSKEGKLQFINKRGDLQDANYDNDKEMVEFILKRSPMEDDFNQHLDKIAKQLVKEIETIQISKENLPKKM